MRHKVSEPDVVPADRLGDLIDGVTGQNRTLAHESKCLIDCAISLNRDATRCLGQSHREFAFAVGRPVPEDSCGGNLRHHGGIIGFGMPEVQGTKRSLGAVTDGAQCPAPPLGSPTWTAGSSRCTAGAGGVVRVRRRRPGRTRA